MMTSHLRFFVLWTLSLAPFWPVLVDLVRLSLHDRRYSHIILIPLISVSLIYLRRSTVFHSPSYCTRVGVPFLLAGVALFGVVNRSLVSAAPTGSLALAAFAIVLVWTAVFVMSYGRQAFGAARFPMIFLLLITPIPPVFLDKAVVALQRGSAEMTHVLFQLAGETVFRDEFRFSLAGVDIEIAEECSAIRSSTALVIASVLAGHVFLRSSWRRMCLSALSIPVAIFTNAARIVALSLLAVYVNPAFLHGQFHHEYGGKVFSLLSISVLAIVLFALRKSETQTRKQTGSGSTPTLPPPLPSVACTETEPEEV